MKLLHNGKALLVMDEKIDAEILDLYNNLKVIGCPMTGLDHIDLEECKKRGIQVISLQGEREFLDEITSTAEHTLGLIIALLRNYRLALNAPYLHRDLYMGHKLKGKRLLLIGGAGRVGSQVWAAAEALGMEVYIFDTLYKESRFAKWLARLTGIGEYDPDVALRMLLEAVDIVSVHVPLAGNEGFFTAEFFNMMKPTAYFINTSRSKVVADSALIWALETKAIAGAAVDFTDEGELREYASENENLVLTNHIAGVTYEDREKTEEFILKKVDAYIKQLTLDQHED